MSYGLVKPERKSPRWGRFDPFGAGWNPYTRFNYLTNAAAYSLQGSESDSTYKLSGGKVTLIADRSGNSAVNAFVNNTAASTSQSLTSPNIAAYTPSGILSVRFDAQLVSWLTASGSWVNHSGAAGNVGWVFDSGTGTPRFRYSNDGTTIRTATCSTAVPASALGRISLRVDYNPATGTVDFFTSPDFTTWSALGTQQSLTAGAIFASTAVIRWGNRHENDDSVAGAMYRVQVLDGATIVWDVRPPLVAKLAASFTESSANAATVTINTSGDLGARISGARDLVQLTAAKMPAFSVVGGYNTATGTNAANKYLKSPAFSLSQPTSFYYVGSASTWTAGNGFVDGSTADSMNMGQGGAAGSPNIVTYAGSLVGDALGIKPVLGTAFCASMVFNGASSTQRLNRGSVAVTGNVGAGNAGGITILAQASLSGRSINGTFNELLVRSVADDATTQLRNAGYFMRKWGIT